MRPLFNALLLPLLLLSGCASPEWKRALAARPAMLRSIDTEPTGNYYVGRRFYKSDFRFWGYVRSPRKPWSTAQLVMFNEHGLLAPDREKGKIGVDNGHEYRLEGHFSGDTVYEPASNRFYPEFVLRGYRLRTDQPGAIFRSSHALNPGERLIVKPY